VAVVRIDGKFYIYIYKDGIHISFNYYNTGHFNYTKAIRFPTKMLDEVIDFIAYFKLERPNNFVVHTYRNLTSISSCHASEFKLLDSQNKK
jgi:hypothetical protein